MSLIVQKQSGQNTVRVVDTVKARLDELRGALPADIDMLVIRDQSKFIKASIHEVQFHLVIGGILVGLTVYLFMRDWRTTLIATTSIPLSIVATFAFMDYMGFTLNNITMLGLILAIGIVIDDAVVINENIFRHMEEYGTPAREAAGAATREIALAVLATTLSLVVIFVPVAFMGGPIGKFFSSFGFTVGFAVLASMAVSFTITPMLCSRFLVLKKGHTGSKSGAVWNSIDAGYGWLLRWSLRRRWVIVVATVVLIGLIVPLFSIVGNEFVPRDDQSEFEVAVTFPEGCSLERADQLFREVEGRLAKIKGVTHVFSTIGDTTGRMARGQGDVQNGVIYCRLVDLGQRRFTQFQKQNEARLVMMDYPELRAAVQDVSAFQASGFRQVMIDLNLRGPDLGKLQEYAEGSKENPESGIVDWMRHQGYFVDIDTSLSMRKPELRVEIDREKASDLGIPVAAIATTLNVLVGGEPVSKYKEGAEQYDVWLRADQSFRDNREKIAAQRIPSPKAGLVQLSNVATLSDAQGPNTIDRFRMQRQVVISANLEGKPLSDAKFALEEHVKSMRLPTEYRFEFIGRAKVLAESNQNFLIAFVLSFIFMYMILASQFESFVHPITILLALPLTVPFALIALLMLRTPLDIFAMFGLFMLFGIVKKNGILQIDYTNVLRAKGMPRDEAILEANHTRLRPILMTTVMLVAAMIPMAMGAGPGAAGRASMAKVIVGGQSLSLLLTLLVTPVAYSLWDDLAQWTMRVSRRRESPAEAEVPADEDLAGEESAEEPAPELPLDAYVPEAAVVTPAGSGNGKNEPVRR